MASGMDLAVGNASKAIDVSGIAAGSIEGLQQGMDLAKRQQMMEQSRQELQFKQQQHEMAKHDWLHDQLKGALSEDDPKLRGVLLDNMDEQFPKLFDGKRVDPATMELMKKSPSFANKMMAAVRIRGAAKSGNFDQLSGFDQEILNGMTSSDLSSKLGQLNQIHAHENDIMKALLSKGVATPQAAAAIGTSQEDLQSKLSQNQPVTARKAAAEDRIINEIGKVKEIQSTRAAQFQVQKALEILNKPDPKWIDFAEANLDLAGLMQQGSSVIPEGRRKDVDFQPGAKIMEGWLSRVSGKEEGGPNQKELDIVKDRLSRLSKVTNEVHDRALLRELQTRSHALKQVGGDPEQVYKNQRLVNQSQFTSTPIAEFQGIPKEQQEGAAAVSQPTISQSQKEQIENDYVARVQQVRQSQKAGIPSAVTEDQLKQTYQQLRQQYNLREIHP